VDTFVTLQAAPARFMHLVTSLGQCIDLKTLTVKDLFGRFRCMRSEYKCVLVTLLVGNICCYSINNEHGDSDRDRVEDNFALTAAQIAAVGDEAVSSLSYSNALGQVKRRSRRGRALGRSSTRTCLSNKTELELCCRWI
jgi:hypothetical protein